MFVGANEPAATPANSAGHLDGRFTDLVAVRGDLPNPLHQGLEILDAFVDGLGPGILQLVGQFGVEHPVQGAHPGLARRTKRELGDLRGMDQPLGVRGVAVEADVGDILELQAVGVAVRFVGESGGAELVVAIRDGDRNHVDTPFTDCQHLLVAVVGEEHVAGLQFLQPLLVLHDLRAAATIGPLFPVRHEAVVH